MAFSYLHPRATAAGSSDRRIAVAIAELQSRAALLYRLGFSVAAATARLVARVAWEYDPRPSALSDQAIGKLVADTYARRPGS